MAPTAILSVERFDREELLTAIRRTRLQGFDRPAIYAEADLALVSRAAPDELVPAQRYVLNGAVRKLLELRAALLEHDLDPFDLDGGAYIRTSDDPEARIPLIPPIVEESHEPDGRTCLLINDGMHRVYAARSVGKPITVLRALGVPRRYPYYALALPRGWSDVMPLDELPDGFEKKTYRNPDSYKALFRDFNAVFPGVQEQRKRSNPGHLTA